jgi:hypothetical protein
MAKPSPHVHATRVIKRAALLAPSSQSHHGKATEPIKKKISKDRCAYPMP